MNKFKNRIIVSCQAEEEEPLHGSDYMKKMAIAAIGSGAGGIRANTPEDVKAIRSITDLPIIGIIKDRSEDYTAFITTRKEHIDALVKAGADHIAMDCTDVTRPEELSTLFSHLRENYPKVSIIADISSIDDVKKVSALKPDYWSTTLSGYTYYSKNAEKPDFKLLKEIISQSDIPVIAEGNYSEPGQVRKALLIGAYSVVIGSAITRPQLITKKFTEFVEDLKTRETNKAIGIDIGGTWIRYITTDIKGKIIKSGKVKNPSNSTKEKIFITLKKVIDDLMSPDVKYIGISTAGRVDVSKGKILFATGNILDWSSADLGAFIEKNYDISPYVNNDSNCAALAQFYETEDTLGSLALITIGTGVGGGFVVNGHVMNGIKGGSGEIGHIIYPGNEKKCTCGKTGCIETLINGKNLLGIFTDEKKDDEKMKEYSEYFAWLIDTINSTIEVEKIFLGGVILKYGDEILNSIREEVIRINPFFDPENICFTNSGEFAGCIGSAKHSILHPSEVKNE